MDFSALGGCHQLIHSVPKRSSMSSEHSFKLWFSRFFTFIPARARLFCLGVLIFLLILPCTYRDGDVTFAFNGIQESDVYMMSDSRWTVESNTRCFYFDPPKASPYYSIPGRFLYPYLVQMEDPVTKQVKSFKSTIIYEIKIQKAKSSANGHGKTFIVDPNSATLGTAAKNYLELVIANNSTLAKNYKCNNHTLGVELDMFKNPEFNNSSDNHIGVNLANKLSTFIVDPVYMIASVRRHVVHTNIWIDYFEVDSCIDIYIGIHGKGKPAMPQRSHRVVDLSLFLKNIKFTNANRMDLGNLPCLQENYFADSFSEALALNMNYISNASSNLLWRNAVLYLSVFGMFLLITYAFGFSRLTMMRPPFRRLSYN